MFRRFPSADARPLPPKFPVASRVPSTSVSRGFVMPVIIWCALLAGGLGRMPQAQGGDMHCPYLRSHACEGHRTDDGGIVAAVTAVVAADIMVPTAARIDCEEPRLPGSREDLIAMLPREHRGLIGECARGRTAVKRRLTGFNLLGLVEESPDETADTAMIRDFFDARSVDVAVGKAVSDGPYPIGFDWAVVLDHDTHTLYSFILNCRD